MHTIFSRNHYSSDAPLLLDASGARWAAPPYDVCLIGHRTFFLYKFLWTALISVTDLTHGMLVQLWCVWVRLSAAWPGQPEGFEIQRESSCTA